MSTRCTLCVLACLCIRITTTAACSLSTTDAARYRDIYCLKHEAAADSHLTYPPAVDAERAGLEARVVGCTEAERTDIDWLPTPDKTTWGPIDSNRYYLYNYRHITITAGCHILTYREIAEEYERKTEEAYTAAQNRANSAWNKVSAADADCSLTATHAARYRKMYCWQHEPSRNTSHYVLGQEDTEADEKGWYEREKLLCSRTELQDIGWLPKRSDDGAASIDTEYDMDFNRYLAGCDTASWAEHKAAVGWIDGVSSAGVHAWLLSVVLGVPCATLLAML